MRKKESRHINNSKAPTPSELIEQPAVIHASPAKAPERVASKPSMPRPTLYSINTSQDRSTVIILGADGEEKNHISLDPDRVQKVYKAPNGKWSLVLFKVRNQQQYGVLAIDLTKGKLLDSVEVPAVPEGVTFGSHEALLSFAAGSSQRIPLQ